MQNIECWISENILRLQIVTSLIINFQGEEQKVGRARSCIGMSLLTRDRRQRDPYEERQSLSVTHSNEYHKLSMSASQIVHLTLIRNIVTIA